MRYMHLINGKTVASEIMVPVLDPATGRAFAEAPQATPAQLDRAIGAAASAFPAWRATPWAERAERLRRCADRLEAEAHALARLMTEEQGQPLGASEAQAQAAAYWLRAVCEQTLEEPTLEVDGRTVTLRRDPIGVVGAIIPWNGPLLLPVWKLAPALLSGNSLVLKPSLLAPLCALRIGELLGDLLPPGVLNVVSGGDETGMALARDPRVRKLTFTGSVTAGRSVYQAAAERFAKVTLELGGNDPAIVLDDADPERIAPELIAGAFSNAGQICAAVKRVYVPRRMHAAVVEALVRHAEALKVGPGIEPDTTMGPMISEDQLLRLSGLVEDAKRRGARIETGGQRLGRSGFFYAPTLITEVPDDARIVREEQFGPALPILAYDDLDDAIRRANDTEFGLGASVWGTDLERAAEVAVRLNAGTRLVNRAWHVHPDVPFGGLGASGIGCEHGLAGLEQYTQLRVLNLPELRNQDEDPIKNIALSPSPLSGARFSERAEILTALAARFAALDVQFDATGYASGFTSDGALEIETPDVPVVRLLGRAAIAEAMEGQIARWRAERIGHHHEFEHIVWAGQKEGHAALELGIVAWGHSTTDDEWSWRGRWRLQLELEQVDGAWLTTRQRTILVELPSS